MGNKLAREKARVRAWMGPKVSGRVTHVIGLVIESSGPDVSLGELCYVYGKKQSKVACQVVGFKEQKVLLMGLGDLSNIAPGAEVYPTEEVHRVAVSTALCGRILDALGRPIDGKGKIVADTFYPVTASAPAPLSRAPIREILPTSIKAIDGLCTLGRGQRIGIFSGPGVGKSTLLGMVAKNAQAHINVIALVGERGREVREFVENELGPEGLARSVVVVATSDQAALLQIKAAQVATAISEYFRDQGQDVLLMMDSISRYAMAERQIGLASGEPPTIRGYPPSIFAKLPALVERTGRSATGSITGIYTVLCEEDEMRDPIADQVRSLLDGHLYLSRELAEARQFPPIDILKSLSRLMHGLVDASQAKQASYVRSLVHTYQEAQELINIGAYVAGSNPKIDEAIAKREAIALFLSQPPEKRVALCDTLEALGGL